jgi:FtsH-binding integral membrane protein
LLVATWGVWVPAVAVIYLLPTALQLPLQNVVLCFFTLLVIFMTRRPADPTRKSPSPAPAPA